MKKFDSVITKARNVPISILLIISTILNWIVGSLISRESEIQANVAEYNSGPEFIMAIFPIVAICCICNIANQVLGKVAKNSMLNAKYLTWIRKLTTSKLSSISTITTGKAYDAINAISVAEKNVVNDILFMVPSLVPFGTLLYKQAQCNWRAVVVTVIGLILYMAYMFVILKMKSFRLMQSSRSDISSVTLDCIKNSLTVKYFHKEAWSIDRQDKAQNMTFAPQVAAPVMAAFAATPTIISLIGIIGAYFCWGNMSVVLFTIMMTGTIDSISQAVQDCMMNIMQKKIMLDLLGKLEPEVDDKIDLGSEGVEIANIEFGYDPEKTRFSISNLRIEKGHRYCVTGKSGFGKSTLAKLLTGTIAPFSGKIPAINSVYMFAESEMFNLSIAENITLGEQSSKKEIVDLLNAFEINVDIDVFTDKVGENGSRLSTGQKQRINLCRTLFYARRHRNALIVMDEVTAALDMATSVSCIKYLNAEFQRLGTTLIYISNKTDYMEVDGFISDNIYVHRNGNTVTYDNVPE